MLVLNLASNQFLHNLIIHFLLQLADSEVFLTCFDVFTSHCFLVWVLLSIGLFESPLVINRSNTSH